MKDGIYRVVFESSLPSFGEGIVVIRVESVKVV